MKKMFLLFIALISVLMAETAMAATKITVNGNGEIRVSADTAVISLGVSSRNKDVLKAQQMVNETIASIRAELIGLGVKEENINTEYINIFAIYDYQNDQEQLASYSASSTLAIKVTDMESIGTLIDGAFAAGANTLNGISFSASNTEEAEAEALKDSVKDAQRKAEILAQAAGLEITGIETISEGSVYNYENSTGNFYGKGGNAIESASDSRTVIQAAKLIVSAGVSVTFSAE